ncbi:apolipoprotein F [Tachyglossus aculeatus]|uniref:apolipoprotein F n=1 Tax=Tachyglossus aculeatus TaxID=9261 RepID=UPI0018F2A318|nr:apolipoprotein F [Tachyglossus aculeatus]
MRTGPSAPAMAWTLLTWCLLLGPSSASKTPALPPQPLSCPALLPSALPSLPLLAPLPRYLVSLALTEALEQAGCLAEARGLRLRLVAQAGPEAAETFGRRLRRPRGAGGDGGAGAAEALSYNLRRLGRPDGGNGCPGFEPLDGARLIGPVLSAHSALPAAKAACRRRGASCAGISAVPGEAFLTVGQRGSRFVLRPGARTWLCRGGGGRRWGRGRRAVDICVSEKERRVFDVVQWVPGVHAYYSLGTALYYGARGCSEAAWARAREAALDLGYSAVVEVSGMAGGPVGVGVSLALRPAVQQLVRHWFTEGKAAGSPALAAGTGHPWEGTAAAMPAVGGTPPVDGYWQGAVGGTLALDGGEVRPTEGSSPEGWKGFWKRLGRWRW